MFQFFRIPFPKIGSYLFCPLVAVAPRIRHWFAQFLSLALPSPTGQSQLQVCLGTERTISWQVHLSLVLKAFGPLSSLMSREWTNRNAANLTWNSSVQATWKGPPTQNILQNPRPKPQNFGAGTPPPVPPPCSVSSNRCSPPKVFCAFLTHLWLIFDAFWNVPLFPIILTHFLLLPKPFPRTAFGRSRPGPPPPLVAPSDKKRPKYRTPARVSYVVFVSLIADILKAQSTCVKILRHCMVAAAQKDCQHKHQPVRVPCLFRLHSAHRERKRVITKGVFSLKIRILEEGCGYLPKGLFRTKNAVAPEIVAVESSIAVEDAVENRGPYRVFVSRLF